EQPRGSRSRLPRGGEVAGSPESPPPTRSRRRRGPRQDRPAREEEATMPLSIRHSAAWAAGQVPTLLTLAALGGLALWGSLNDWKLPATHAESEEASADKESSEEGIKVTGGSTDSSSPSSSPSGGPARIEFP